MNIRALNREGNMAHGRTFMVGMVCGAIAGATVALMYAPAAGVDTRRHLGRSANRFSKRANRLYRDASDAAADLAAGGADLLDQMKDAGARLVADAKG